ncbi:MAG TPA: hypothetical protein VFX60_12495 [Micromonospora sp.]|nr:hypothetical protein [Micromonospora sp.]
MIKAHVMDAAALAARTPAELSSYLRANGWQLTRRTETVAFWTLPVEDDELEIMQPLDPGLRDYALRVGDAVVVLAAVEDRSELEILRRISESTWDVHAVSLFPPEEPPGMIAIEDGVTAYESLRSLINAAAYPIFARQQRAVQPARKPQGLADFMRSVRIGVPVQGSYVLTAHTPVPPRLSGQPTLFDDAGFGLPEDEPLERQVSLLMYRAVRAAYDAADAALLTADGLEPFNEAVSRGVSANLCEALAGFGGSEGHPFQLAVSLAATRHEVATLSPVRFRRDHLPVLKEAAAELRALTPEEDVAVIGEVVRLHREDQTGGEITVIGRVEDSEVLRRIWMNLSISDYQEATTAHQKMRQVTVRGSLVRRGTRYFLASPTGFRVLPESDAD